MQNVYQFQVVTPQGEAIGLGMLTFEENPEYERIAGEMLDRMCITVYQRNEESGDLTYLTTVAYDLSEQETECNASVAESN